VPQRPAAKVIVRYYGGACHKPSKRPAGRPKQNNHHRHPNAPGRPHAGGEANLSPISGPRSRRCASCALKQMRPGVVASRVWAGAQQQLVVGGWTHTSGCASSAIPAAPVRSIGMDRGLRQAEIVPPRGPVGFVFEGTAWTWGERNKTKRPINQRMASLVARLPPRLKKPSRRSPLAGAGSRGGGGWTGRLPSSLLHVDRRPTEEGQAHQNQANRFGPSRQSIDQFDN
jgi:hypothetical protein